MGRRACTAASGLGEGLRFCRDLQRRVAACRLEDFASIRAVAGLHLNPSYAQFLARNKAWYEAHPEAPKVLCFILTGYIGAD